SQIIRHLSRTERQRTQLVHKLTNIQYLAPDQLLDMREIFAARRILLPFGLDLHLDADQSLNHSVMEIASHARAFHGSRVQTHLLAQAFLRVAEVTEKDGDEPEKNAAGDQPVQIQFTLNRRRRREREALEREHENKKQARSRSFLETPAERSR